MEAHTLRHVRLTCTDAQFQGRGAGKCRQHDRWQSASGARHNAQLAAMVFRLGMVSPDRLSDGNVFSTVAMIVGSAVRFASSCLMLLI